MSRIRATNLAAVNLNLLVALDALLDERSVSAAARRVGLSQPAMSHTLARLRAHFDDPLLVRVHGAMTPTPFATSVRAPLRAALDQLHGVLAPPRFDPATSTRRFELMMSDYAAHLVLPPLNARLRALAPGVRLQVQLWVEGRASAYEEAARRDLAVTCDEHTPPGFYRQVLFRDRDVVAIARRHRARGRALADPERFLRAPHVAVIEVPGRPDPVDAWLTTLGHARRVAVEVPQYLMALQLVASSDAIAVIPERLVRSFAAALGLATLPVPIDAGSFEELMLCPERVHHDPAVVWLRRELGRLFAPSARRRD